MNKIDIEGPYKKRYVKFHREFPEGWHEITREHLDIISEVFSSDQPVERHAEMILFRFLKLPNKIYWNLDPAYIEQLQAQLIFLWQDNTLPKVLYPKIFHNEIAYLGPDSAFKNIPFIDWIVGEQYFQKYQKTKSDDDLNCVIYSMYRPMRIDMTPDHPDYNGDMREILNDNTIEEKSKVFKSLSKEMKMMAYMTYIGNRNTVMQRFDSVFNDVERKGISDPYSWSGVLVDMTGTKWKTRKEVEQEKAYHIFIHWHQNILRLEEWEMQMENNKKNV